MKRHLSFAAGLLTLCIAAGWTIHLSVRNVSDYQGLDWENTKLRALYIRKTTPQYSGG
ncbi:MAG: hypothetical protein HC859_08610 [Bacteroidia bacterium]|nr:hypothetical protein [Bacteroidia bacterium]